MKYLIIFCTLLIGCAGQNGTNGVNGLDGSPGIDGTDGANGKDGYSCTVEDTIDGALITCEDGSESVVEDGEDLLPSPTPVPIPAPNTCIEYKQCNRHGKCKTKRICFFRR